MKKVNVYADAILSITILSYSKDELYSNYMYSICLINTGVLRKMNLVHAYY